MALVLTQVVKADDGDNHYGIFESLCFMKSAISESETKLIYVMNPQDMGENYLFHRFFQATL
ncbi:MAG: hypothetical protein ACWA6R_07335, partial [Nitrosomonas sp.]